MKKKYVALSVLCAISGIGLYPVVVHATGTSVVSDQEDIIGNSYSINETPINSVYTVYSAMHKGAGTVTQNTITVQADLNWDTSSRIPAQLYGGYSNSGLASYNTVNVSATDVYDVCGGASKYYGSATYNKVIVGNDVKAGKWNKATYALVVGGVVINGSADSVAQYNEVTIKATDKNLKEDYYIDYVLGGQIRGKNQGDVLDNKATLERGHINLLIGGESASGNAIRNHVFLEGGLVASRDQSLNGGGVYGGTASISASENTVTITGGKVIGDVLGGTNASDASGNVVSIFGGEIIGSVWGGRATVKAIDNVVTVEGKPNLARASLFGGEAPNTQGNTLNVKTSGIVVQQIGDFQKLNFHIDQAFDSVSLLEIIGDQSTDISGSDVNVYLNNQALPKELGKEIVLIENSQGLITNEFTGSINYSQPAGLLDYGLSFNATETSFGVQVTEIEVKPETKSILTSNLSRMAFVNQGSDLVVGQGLGAVRESVQNGRRLFVALQTGSNHYNIDSYIDLEGESLLMGGSWSVGAPDSQVTLGAFFESGWADYEVENALTPLSILKGKGETHYQGGGLLAYWDQYSSADNGLYAEASLRLGRADLSYQTVASLTDFDYDVKATYWAAHVGMGYRYAFNDTNNVDLYTKYFYSHQDSDDFMIDQNSVKMDSIKSKRWRIGLSYCHRGFTPEDCVFDWQAALAYEYEFDGKAEGSVDGYRILDSELEGSTGIGELSINFLPSEDSGTRVRASIHGFVGARKGYFGQIRWTQMF